MISKPLGEPGSAVAQRRILDALESLDKRQEARGISTQLDFGGGGTSASKRVGGLAWLRSNSVITFGLTGVAQLTADLRVAAVDIEPGKGFTLQALCATSLSGLQSIHVIVV